MQLQTHDHFGRQHIVNADKDPDHCPICHRGIAPKNMNNDCLILNPPKVLERILRCPREECGHLFVSRYILWSGNADFRLSTSVPYELPDYVGFAEEVTALSPDFYAIYNEAQKAEASRWKLIAGPGYRKALEFLIKDYAWKLHPTEMEQIHKLELGRCIEKYMTNPMVKETAKRAAWLGNDETHYLRKWEGKDLQDLKELLMLVVSTIHSELLYYKLKAEMPEGKK